MIIGMPSPNSMYRYLPSEMIWSSMRVSSVANGKYRYFKTFGSAKKQWENVENQPKKIGPEQGAERVLDTEGQLKVEI